MLVTETLIAGTAPLGATGCIPRERTLTGTFSTSGVMVTGTGTLFTTQLFPGQYLYDTTQNLVRRIISVDSDVIARLETAFPVDSSAQAVKVSNPLYTSLTIIPTGACTLNGIVKGVSDGVISYNNGNINPVTFSGSIRFEVGYLR